MRAQPKLTIVLSALFFSLNTSLLVSDEILTSNEVPIVPESQCQEALEEIRYEIEAISNQIERLGRENSSTAAILELYNARGVRYFCVGMFEHALEDFKHVMTVSLGDKELQDSILALALWGSLFCHAFQNQDQEAFQDLDLFKTYFLPDCPCGSSKTVLTNSPSCKENRLNFQDTSISYASSSSHYDISTDTANHANGYYFRSIANFANPNERLTVHECRDRVETTAKLMRILALKIPNAALAATTNIVIGQLEDFFSACCYRNHWTECLSPVIDAYQYMKRCMDRGVSIAPKLIFPGR